MKSRKRFSIVSFLLLLALSAGALGCGGGADVEASTGDKSEESDATAVAGDDDEDEEQPVPVEVAALERGTIESVLRFSANLEAENEVQVISQAKRLVRELLVEEGDRVAKNQVLVRLQDEEQRSQLAKVRSQLEKAEREFRQQERLHQQELISEQAFTDARFELEQLQISLEDAERELGYTEVRAPIAGTVTQRLVKVGDQVQISQHLFDIVDFDSMVARIFIPEKHLAGLRRGLKARISAAATGQREYLGKVDRVAPIVDPQSGTVKVTIALGAQEGLRPGLYVDVDLVTAIHENAVLIPKRALVYDADQIFVFRLDDERRVEQVFIEPSLSDKHFVEPISGLNAGDQVVIAGQTGLKDQALVELPGDRAADKEGASESEEIGTAQQVTS